MVRSAFDWVRRPLGWVTFGDDSDQACACAPPPAAAIAAPPAAADPMPDVSEVGAGAAGKGASACAWLLDMSSGPSFLSQDWYENMANLFAITFIEQTVGRTHHDPTIPSYNDQTAHVRTRTKSRPLRHGLRAARS